jgi:purine-binding chemotaxis protein CheW
VAVPATAPALVGLVGIRGDVVPVFGLSTLLGYHADADPGAASWLVLCAADEPMALAVSTVDGHLRLPRSAIHAAGGGRDVHAHVDEIAVTDAGARPVIAVSRIVAAIRQRSGRSRPQEER